MKQTQHFYGPTIDITALKSLFDQLLQFESQASTSITNNLPICIWGPAGIGKTSVVHEYATQKNYQIVHLALAQLEEMGDLLGMPSTKQAQTVFLPPDWVPTAEGPGILLIDDFNRADPRILNGIMQLLQEGRMMGWTLPLKWKIILTGNPMEDSYQVNLLDEAILTRMIHFNLSFNWEDWKKWALTQAFEPILIEFIKEYPDVLNEKRCNPRTYAQLCFYLKQLKNWENQLDQLELIAHSIIGEIPAKQLVAYLSRQQISLPTVSQILKAADFQTEVYPKILERITFFDGKTVDTFFLLKQRLIEEMNKRKQSLNQNELKNLKHFLMLKEMPGDLRFGMVQELMNMKHLELHQLLRDPQLAKLIL